MASLSELQAKHLLANPKNRARLKRISQHHNRLRLHVEATDNADTVSPAKADFLKWVHGILPEDKYNQLVKYLLFPVATTEITKRIFAELGRAFTAENKYIRHEFENPANAADFELYKARLQEANFWASEGFQHAQTAINSVCVVDLPTEQAGSNPEPYYYLRPLTEKDVWDVEFKRNGEAEYLILPHADGVYAVLDDDSYRTFQKLPSGEYLLLSEAPHGLGYCPARRFWSDLLSLQNTLEAEGPLSTLLGKLDSYLFHYLSTEYFKAFGKWPIYWEYTDDDPKHLHPQQPGVTCKKGMYTYTPTGTVIGLDGKATQQVVEPCALCKASKYVGPGSIKKVDPPTGKNEADLREPVGFVSPPTESIEAAIKDLQRLETALIRAATGEGGEPVTDQPRNELDVRAGFEGKQSVLLDFKRNCELLDEWKLGTLAKLRYSDYLRSTVFYGDQFYLQSEREVQTSYETQKKAGLPDYVLSQTRELLTETRYRTNEELRLRSRILANLEPFPDMSKEELRNMITSAGTPPIRPELVALKLNFDYYIKRFERENMSVVTFGEKVAFAAKINTIADAILAYAKEDATAPVAPPLT